jgi:hypothetical protein
MYEYSFDYDNGRSRAFTTPADRLVSNKRAYAPPNSKLIMNIVHRKAALAILFPIF